MKIRIKEFNNGQPACGGFFPREGVKIMPSRWVRDEKSKRQFVEADVYECETDAEFEACLDTGLVEAVIERKKPGRPRKEDVEA